MRSALPRLGGRSATVLGSLAVVVPLVSGVPAAGVAADPAPGVGGVATVAAALPPSGAATLVRPVAARPVTPEVAEVPVPEADRPGAPHLAAVSEPQPVDGFGVVGATWRGNEPRALDLQVRTKDGGTWSGWEELPVHAEHAPDPGTAEARAATRTGSDPVVVGDVDRVQVRATSASGEAPGDLELSVVDPGTSPADDDPATVATTVGAPAAGAAAGDPTGARPALFTGTTALASQVAVRNPPGVRAPRPRIRSRRAWGANERLSPGSPSYGTVRRGFVHHTVNANDYTRGEVPAIIRGIHSYHTQSLGWRDVGYNFLVDRFGRIWEGRKGGVTRAVIGAHTSGYNHVAFAMSAIGNFETARPRSPMVRAYGRLMGWKLGLHRVRASARTIDGHRDVGQTACPGRHLYRKVKDGSIHRRARRWQVGGTAPAPEPKPKPKPEPEPEPQPQPKPAPEPTEPPRPDEPGLVRDLQADGFPDLLAREAGTQRLKVLAGDGGPGFTSRQVAVERVGASALVTGVGDVTRDGRPDLLIRHPRTKVAKVRPGRRNGGFGRAIAATRRFAEADLLAGVGDMVSNRRPDLVMREARSGRVWLVPGQRNGKWGRKRLVIRRGGGLTLLGGGGDLDGDGRRDLVARDGRRLLLYPGRRKGRVGAPRVIGRGWRGKDLAAAGYDVTGDGRDDLVARDRRSRRTWIYVTRDDGSIAGRFGGWRGWRDLNRLTGAGDVTRDGNADLVGRTSDGQLVVLPSRGTRWLQGPVDTGRWARKANFAQVVGDWNDDGYADVVSRANGTIWLYRGKGGGTLGRHVVLRRKWGNRTFLATPGDMDGDGLPDLVSRTPDGRIWVHTSNGRRGVKSRYVAREGMFKADLVTAAGFWDDDPYRDLVVRRARSKELFLVPGTKDGEFGRPVPLDRGQSYADYDQIVGVGHFNRDRYPDIVARERRTGRMWLFAGSGTGLLRAREFVGLGMDRYDLFG